MITVAGLTPSVDITYLVDSLRLGRIHRPTAVVRCAGGKPLNLSRAAAALGAEVAVVALLGGRTGQWLSDELERAGVDVARVAAGSATRTCVSIASADRSDLTEIYEYAEEVPPAEWADFTTTLRSRLERRPGWLAISGGPPRKLGRDALAVLARLAHDAGVRVAADTHGPSLAPLVDARPELVKINRDEAAELLEADPETALSTLAERIRERSGGIVVLTDGASGSVATDGQEILRAPAPGAEHRGRYPVGSGDAFLGGLLMALDRGDRLADALRLAAGAGSANALLPGPGVLDAAAAYRMAAELRLA